jgi:hypothetical protein
MIRQSGVAVSRQMIAPIRGMSRLWQAHVGGAARRSHGSPQGRYRAAPTRETLHLIMGEMADTGHCRGPDTRPSFDASQNTTLHANRAALPRAICASL